VGTSVGILIGIALIVAIYFAPPAAKRPDRRPHVAVVLGMLLAANTSLAIGDYPGVGFAENRAARLLLSVAPFGLFAIMLLLAQRRRRRWRRSEPPMSGSVVPRKCVWGVLGGRATDCRVVRPPSQREGTFGARGPTSAEPPAGGRGHRRAAPSSGTPPRLRSARTSVPAAEQPHEGVGPEQHEAQCPDEAQDH
jgi:hypothetical protein